MPRGSWANSLEYTMREDHINPEMRPSIDLLVHKLRNLSSLKNHPEAVKWVIEDLAYHFFVDEEKRPEFLFEIGSSALWRFFHLAGGNMDEHGLGAIKPEVGTTGPGEGDSVAGKFTAGEAPNLDSPNLILAVQDVIVKHRATEYVHGRFRCRCKKLFSSGEKWAFHVRKKIWKKLNRTGG